MRPAKPISRLRRRENRQVSTNKLKTYEKRALRAELYQKQAGLCWICQRPMLPLSVTGASAAMAATFDHIKPQANGGEWVKENLKLAHKTCNTRRGSG